LGFWAFGPIKPGFWNYLVGRCPVSSQKVFLPFPWVLGPQFFHLKGLGGPVPNFGHGLPGIAYIFWVTGVPVFFLSPKWGFQVSSSFWEKALCKASIILGPHISRFPFF